VVAENVRSLEPGNGLNAATGAYVNMFDAGISLGQSVAESADAYYQALLDSTHGWHDGKADPWPWLSYFTGLIAEAYSVFADRAAAAKVPGTKQERVRAHILRHAPAICPSSHIRKSRSWRGADVSHRLPAWLQA
jgi:hypothetical protein